MTKYKLVKDLPGIPAGTIAEKDQYDIYTFLNGHRSARVNSPDVEEDPEWFALVEEKEFTRQDFHDYFHFKSMGTYDPKLLDLDIGLWLKKRNHGSQTNAEAAGADAEKSESCQCGARKFPPKITTDPYTGAA